MTSSLLCPTMLPPLVVLCSLVFGATTLALPLVLAYRFIWFLLYHPGPLMMVQPYRLRGTVAGPGPMGTLLFGRQRRGGQLVALPFELLVGGMRIMVNPANALLGGWPRRVRVGSRVTVDGMAASVPHHFERLFRDPASEPGIQAVQIIKGTWPACRGLTRFVLLSWLGSLLVVAAFFFLY